MARKGRAGKGRSKAPSSRHKLLPRSLKPSKPTMYGGGKGK